MTRHPVKSLYVFDIDDTLFRTSARARVVNTKGQVKYLSSEELKDYEFSASEKICFAEFRDAKKFAEESQPIESMIKIAQDCIQKTAEGSKTILLTARADLDCKTKFLEYLNSSGLDTNNIYIERAGNLPNLKTSEAKKIITQAQETIQSEKNAAISDLKNQVASLSVEIAEKVLKEKLSNDKAQMDLVKNLIKDVTLK